MRLGDYVSVKTGKLDANAADENGEYPFFTCSVNCLRINRYDYDCECVLVAGNGDLNVKYYDGKFNAYQRTYIIESNDKNVLLVPYLYRFMEKYVERLRSDAIGGVIKYIKLSNITDADIHICTLDEQREKVNILDRVDALICKYQLKQALMEDIVKSRFVEMFGDPVSNSMGWKIVKLVDVCDKVTDGTHFSPESYAEGDYKYVTAKNIKESGFDFANITYVTKDIHSDIFSRCNPEYGDVLYIKDGVTTGIAMVNTLHEEFSLLSSVALIKQNRDVLNGTFLCAVLNNDNMYRTIRSMMGGAAITRLTVAKIKPFKIIIPPINLQNQFADFVAQADKSKLAIQQSIETLQTLKAKLMQDYFG